ncbi:MAG: ribbon-helix-helix protein, CopG family [bacterium]|nr:ribbon-helix-helix protein, CopG family [bacterium]
MGTRTVRLDDEAEQALDEIRRETGMTISEALKRGLLALHDRVHGQRAETPWAVYERLDLGPGGYSSTPARDAKKGVLDAIRRKKRR